MRPARLRTREATGTPRRYQFDEFELRPEEAVLLRAGEEVRLAPRPFAVLQALLEAGGATLSKDALIAQFWNDVGVTDDALVQAIAEIRRALGDDARNPRMVRTVHGRGYRFIGPVSSDDGSGILVAVPMAKPTAAELAAELISPRLKVVVGVGSLVVLVLAVAVGVLSWLVQRGRARELAHRASVDLSVAEALLERANTAMTTQTALDAAALATASLARNPANPGAAAPYADAARLLPGSAASLQAAASLAVRARALARYRQSRVMEAAGPVWGLAVVAPTRELAVLGDGPVLQLLDLATGGEARRLTLPWRESWALSCSPAGDLLAAAGSDGGVLVWDAATHRPLAAPAGHVDAVREVVVAPGGRLVATGGDDGTVRLHDPQGGALVAVLSGHEGPVDALAFSPDGARLASGSRDRTVRVWSLASRRALLTLHGHRGVVRDVAFSPDGTLVTSASYDRTLRVFDAASGAARFVADRFPDEVHAVAFAPDGRTVAAACEDGSVHLVDVASGSSELRLDGHCGPLQALAFDPASGALLAGGISRRVVEWVPQEGHPVMGDLGQGYLWSVRFSPDGKRLAAAGADGAVRLFEVATGRLERSLVGHRDLVAEVAFSPDGRTVASAGYDRTVRVWDVGDGRCLRVLEGHTALVRTVAFSPDGLLLASGASDQAVLLWDTAGWQLRRRLPSAGGKVRRVLFAPDSGALVTAGEHQPIRLWDPATGAILAELPFAGAACGLAVEPALHLLAASGMGGELAVFDTTTRAPLLTLSRGPAAVFAVAFTPDGRHLLGGTDDRRLVLWELPSGRETLALPMPQAVMAVAVSAATGLVAVGEDSVARLYPGNLATLLGGDPLALAAAAARDAGLEPDPGRPGGAAGPAGS